MSDAQRLHVDPSSYKLDKRFFTRLYRLSRPYWARPGAWKSWLLLGAICAIGAQYSLFGALNNQAVGEFTNALVGKRADDFWSGLTLATIYLLLRYGFMIASNYLDARLNLHWRTWLTTSLVDKYLDRRTYFEIAQDQKLDNPDQRIQEEVGPFCQAAAMLPQQLVSVVLDISVQLFILMHISKTLFAAVCAFAAVKTITLLWIYKPTIKQNFEVTVAEADLRFGILHVRDNAETVAFYRGEKSERIHIVERLKTAIQKSFVKAVYEVIVLSAEFAYMIAWGVFPMLFLAPLFLTDKIQYGVIAQGSAAAMALLQSLSLFMRFIPTLAMAAPKLIRLAEIQEKFEALEKAREPTPEAPRITFRNGRRIELDSLSLQTPGGEQKLVRNLSMTLDQGESAIIIGRTGVGKSSLLRAMAGLWTRGEGVVTMPPPDEALFLPQRPYMILANLRSQLLYPSRKAGDLTDAELQAILERVSLPDLAERHGGFDSIANWSRLLSLGEQQRIAFARVLVTQPKFVFLDEATSAVDIETETLLYKLMARSGAGYVSVGHRPSLLDCHQRALRLLPDGSWAFLPARQLATSQAEIETELELAQ